VTLTDDEELALLQEFNEATRFEPSEDVDE
jgi:hypothetical protein